MAARPVFVGTPKQAPGDAAPTRAQEQALFAGAAYVAARLLSAATVHGFEANVLFAITAWAAACAHFVLRLEPQAVVELVAPVVCAAGAFSLLLRGGADALVIAFLAAWCTKPAPSSFDGGRALRDAVTASSASSSRSGSSSSLWDRVVQRAQATIDEIVASLATQAADVAFYDCHVLVLARVALPTGTIVIVVGAFHRWTNLNAAAPPVARALAEYLGGARQRGGPASNANNSGAVPRAGARTILVRLPTTARPGQRLSTVAPTGETIEFVCPDGAVPGGIIQLRVNGR